MEVEDPAGIVSVSNRGLLEVPRFEAMVSGPLSPQTDGEL